MAKFKAGRYLALGALTVLAPVAGLLPAAPAGAAVSGVTITEVNPFGSGASYANPADWFEVTNPTASPVTVTGWKMDDNSNAFGSAVPMIGITTIAPGESVIFVEGGAAQVAAFKTAWFGASPPSGLQVGSYTGSGVGLSTSGDAVNVYDSTGALQFNVSFGASDPTSPFQTFDNAAAVSGPISTLSAVGTNGAFVAANDSTEVGSPGAIANSTPVPEVPYLVLLPASGIAALGAFVLIRRRRAAVATV